jgi:transposase InsO family protein
MAGTDIARWQAAAHRRLARQSQEGGTPLARRRFATAASAQEAQAVVSQGQRHHSVASNASQPRVEHRFRPRQAEQRTPLQNADCAGRIYPSGITGCRSVQDGLGRCSGSAYPLLLEHGKPEFIRSDNGPEFVAAPLREWLARVGIKSIQIYPGSPWENGSNERFNGTLRNEVLRHYGASAPRRISAMSLPSNWHGHQ